MAFDPARLEKLSILISLGLFDIFKALHTPIDFKSNWEVNTSAARKQNHTLIKAILMEILIEI